MGELFSGMSFERDGSKYYLPAVDGTEIFNDGKAEGKIDGKAEATAECAAKHFAQIVDGSGTDVLRFGPVPFAPDMVEVMCFRGVHGDDPSNRDNIRDSIVHLFTCDLRSIDGTDTLSGVSLLSKRAISTNGTPIQNGRFMLASPATAATKYSRSEDGTVTIKNVTAAESGTTYTGTFADNCKYICVAVKVT